MRATTPSACRLALSLGLSIAACAARPPPDTSTARPTVESASVPLAPAALRVLHGDRVECTLAADGRIEIDGHEYARMEARRVVSTAGRELARLEGSTVRFAGADFPGTLSPDGALDGPDGQRMFFDADGRVAFTSPTHHDERVLPGTRIDGLTPASRAAGIVLVGVLMFRAREARADAESP